MLLSRLMTRASFNNNDILFTLILVAIVAVKGERFFNNDGIWTADNIPRVIQSLSPAGGVFTKMAKTAEELGVPECRNNIDCVVGGVCVKDQRGKGRCFCSSSCPLNVPMKCAENNAISCVSMGEQYTSKYALRPPLCYHVSRYFLKLF